jgi:hypothetical protein
MFFIHLYTTFYPENNPDRLQELLTCLELNLSNNAIQKVTVLNEGGDLFRINNQKLTVLNIPTRPTYQDFFDYINKNSNKDTINIIANTDIYFDENIGVLHHLDLSNKCLALSRWDTTETEKPLLYNHNDSQDVWIFKGQPKQGLSVDFPLGVPRCDNRLLHELHAAEYKVMNPAFSIKAFHLHAGQRALVYTEEDNLFKIQPPYRYLYPHNYFGFWKTLFFNISHPVKLGRYRYDRKKVNRWWVIRLPRKILEVISGKKMPLIGYE